MTTHRYVSTFFKSCRLPSYCKRLEEKLCRQIHVHFVRPSQSNWAVLIHLVPKKKPDHGEKWTTFEVWTHHNFRVLPYPTHTKLFGRPNSRKSTLGADPNDRIPLIVRINQNSCRLKTQREHFNALFTLVRDLSFCFPISMTSFSAPHLKNSNKTSVFFSGVYKTIVCKSLQVHYR